MPRICTTCKDDILDLKNLSLRPVRKLHHVVDLYANEVWMDDFDAVYIRQRPLHYGRHHRRLAPVLVREQACGSFLEWRNRIRRARLLRLRMRRNARLARRSDESDESLSSSDDDDWSHDDLTEDTIEIKDEKPT